VSSENLKDEITQDELFDIVEKEQFDSIRLIDTIAKPLPDDFPHLRYNPYELKSLKAKTLLVFYCDSGNTTKSRISEYRKRFGDFHCVSLRGGRAYWNPTKASKYKTNRLFI